VTFFAKRSVVRVLDNVILTPNFLNVVVTEGPVVLVIFLSSFWGSIAILRATGCVSHGETVHWISREATLSISNLNIFDKSADRFMRGALVHDTHASHTITAIDDSVCHCDISGSPCANSIFSPVFTLLVQAVEVLKGCIVGFACNLEALTSWEWSRTFLAMTFFMEVPGDC